MLIRSKKYPKPDWKKKHRKRMKKAIEWFTTRYGITKEVCLFHEPRPFNLGSMGYDNKNKRYGVFISPENHLSWDATYRTLFHELWHVKQHFFHEMSHKHDKWRGKDYSKVDYQHLPWEVEAYAVEDILFDLWRAQE